MADQQGVEAVEKALRLLGCFGPDRGALTLAELSRRSGFYKSAILRMAASLEKFGYLIKGTDGQYRLGHTVSHLAAIYRMHFDGADVIRAELRNLALQSGETASLYTRMDSERICLFRENAKRELRHHLTEGQRLPLELGAPSKILLAFGPEQKNREDIVSAGYALSMGERDPELASVAAPIFGSGAELVGALTVSGLISRFDAAARQRIVDLVKASAGRLTEALQSAGE